MFQPDSEYYRVGILRSFNLKFESASPQLVIIQLFDGIYLKVNDPNECQTGIDRANITWRTDKKFQPGNPALIVNRRVPYT